MEDDDDSHHHGHVHVGRRVVDLCEPTRRERQSAQYLHHLEYDLNDVPVGRDLLGDGEHDVVVAAGGRDGSLGVEEVQMEERGWYLGIDPGCFASEDGFGPGYHAVGASGVLFHSDAELVR